MARASKTKPNVKLAPKLTKNSLNSIGKALAHIGKPFFFLFSYSTIAFLFTLQLIGSLTRILFTSFFKILIKAVSGLKQIKLPKIALPRIPLKLLGLKIKLRLAALPPIKIRIPRPRIKPLLISLILLFGLTAFFFWLIILRDLPSPKELTTRNVEVSTKIYDRNGALLYKIYKDQNRTIVPLEQIPLHVRLATLAIEDAEFYSHPGFSVRGILRAVIRNLKKGELTGGSTITQQLVKNALLTSEKTIIRKIKEIILAIGVELTFSKDQILEMYLNEVSYGGTAYGIQEAAQVYFDKNVNNLTIAEASLLAGLPKSPTKFSPFGPNPDLAINRQKEVLRLMKVNKYITKEQRAAAEKQKLVFADNKTNIRAPHFVMFVKQLLVEKYGEEMVEKGGLEVITTLDYSIQKMAEEVVRDEVKKLANLKVTNGAALVVEPKTGEILAMVGSKNYFNTEAGGNVNVVAKQRQPGSAIKLINYAYALSHNFTPATVISDSPVTFSVQGQPPYSPRNYDYQFRGNISLRSALAESRNVPAVKVLASYGVNKMIEMGQAMGITTWNDPSRFGLSLTLGGGEVKLIDLATAYATVANYGEKPEFVSILEIKNYKGKVLEENKCTSSFSKLIGQSINLAPVVMAAEATTDCKKEQVLDPRVAFLLIDILKDNIARAPAFGSYSQLNISKHPEVVVKTGTSNNLRDNWTVGFNQKYLVAVWVGNNDGSPMSRVASGVTGAAPIWNKIMRGVLAKEESQDWEIPEGIKRIAICSLTESLPCEGCPTGHEWFLEETVPQKACNPEQLKQIVKEKEEEKEKKKKQESTGRILVPAARTEQRFFPWH